MLTVVVVGYAVLLAQGVPSWSELSQLGVVALAMIVGAVGVGIPMYRWGIKPERARYEQERIDRIAAQTEEKTTRAELLESVKISIPVLGTANENSKLMLQILSREGGK
jgi:hypothetical protein